MGMILPIGHVVSPILAMPLYMVSPTYPYLLGFIIMFFTLLFVEKNSRHKWIRNKGYRRVPQDQNQAVEEG